MMINNKRSYTEYNITNPTTDFAIGFENYGVGAKDIIEVTLNGVLVESLGHTVRLKNAQVLEVTPAIEAGTVRLQRVTGIDSPFHKFTAGALFTAKSMDENFEQIRHSQQEVNDGFIVSSNKVNSTLNDYSARITDVETDVSTFNAKIDNHRTVLDAKINSSTSTLNTKINNTANTLNSKIIDESQARIQGDLANRRYTEDLIGMGQIWDGISSRAVYDYPNAKSQEAVNQDLKDKIDITNTGYRFIDSFELGNTITQRNQALRHAADGKLYRWAGNLPKVVPTSSTPENSGGFGANAWLEVSDIALRQDIVTGGLVTDSLVKTVATVTGSIERNQASVNSDRLSARDFGAKGDGVTDDTLALKAFIEAGGGLLHATDSFYAISGGITVTNPFTIKGVYGTPKIKLVDNSSGTLIRANGVLGVSISNLDLDGNEAMQPLENGGHALRFDNCTQVCLMDIYAHDTMQSTISMTNVDYFAFKNVRVEVSRSDGIKFTNCSMGVMDNILSKNHPKSNKHPNYGQVSAIELHDGSNNIHLRNIRIINDDTDPTVGQGLNITSHDPEVAITHSIIVDGLYTSGMYNGVNIINETNNVVINNHTSVNDRAAVLITADASDITFNDFNYIQDSIFEHTSTAYGIYLGANSKNISFNNGSFLSRVSCVASIATTKNLRNINFYNCDFVSLNSRALKLEGGNSEDYVDMSFYNCSFESNMSGNVQNTIGMASNAGSLYCRVEFTRCTFRGDAPSATRSIMEVSWNGLILNNCTFYSEKKSAITFMHSVTDTDINHCKFYGLSDGKPTIEIRAVPKNLKFKHNDVYGHSQAFLINSISSAESVIQNVIINDNYFDCSSSVFRFLNEADSIYIDKFMLNNNVKMNANWVYSNLKLGVNSTNIVSVGNIPEAQLVVPVDGAPETEPVVTE